MPSRVQITGGLPRMPRALRRYRRRQGSQRAAVTRARMRGRRQNVGHGGRRHLQARRGSDSPVTSGARVTSCAPGQPTDHYTPYRGRPRGAEKASDRWRHVDRLLLLFSRASHRRAVYEHRLANYAGGKVNYCRRSKGASRATSCTEFR